ncbi:MAG TPA: hypothetical protein PLG66_11505 [Calditrichia bacterium]|nr:hypothetical protein [Calditrichia bacterium]
MKYGTFVGEMNSDRQIEIPQAVRQKLMLEPGDMVEVSIKKIKSGRIEMRLAENPLYKLLKITPSGDDGASR